jgi:hypothetical protein
MHRSLLPILWVAAVLVACGGSGDMLRGPAGNSGGMPGTPDHSGDESGRGGAGGAPSPGIPPDGENNAVAGVLTAGIWDDNLNYHRFSDYRDSQAALFGRPDFTVGEQDDAELRARARASATALDIALVIDTTGSMGDEITYLQAEFDELSRRIARDYPGVSQRWAIVAYRDVGDDYVVRTLDLGGDLQARQHELDGLVADGGGDIPEAPERGLEAAAQLGWSQEPGVARVAFWVADAPHHTDQAGAFTASVRALRDSGVHVYPVAASGVDELAEYSMRATAQLTLGRYLFLTDDSGVGGSHKEPTIPCYWVTRLDHAMERALRSELEGARVEIDASEVLRAVGSPHDGQCTPDQGAVTYVF